MQEHENVGEQLFPLASRVQTQYQEGGAQGRGTRETVNSVSNVSMAPGQITQDNYKMRMT